MLRPKALKVLSTVLILTVLPIAHALEPGSADGPGIGLGTLLAPQWQLRLSRMAESQGRLSAPEAPHPRLSLFGDYYLPRGFGLRATGGLVLGKKAGEPFPAVGLGSGHRLAPRPSAWGEEPQGASQEPAHSAVPYFGLGYTGLKVRGNLGFFADVGLQGFSPRSSVRLGNSSVADPNNGADLGRGPRWSEWHFAPVLQLGVSYAF